MAEIRSSFIVDVGTSGASAAKSELAQIQRQTADASKIQREGLSGAAKAMASMNRTAGQLVGKFSDLERAIRSVNSALKLASRTSRGIAPGLYSGTVGPGGVATGAGGLGTRAAAPPVGYGHVPSRQERPPPPRTSTASGPVFGPRNAGPEERWRYAFRQQAQDRALQEEQKRRQDFEKHAFGHGLLQGMLPGNLGFVQRGPGAIKQGLGMMTGNIASSLLSIPFLGAGGLGMAAGALGSAVSAPLSRYMNKADESMSFQRQQMQMMPLLAGMGTYDSGGGPTEAQMSRAALAATDRRMKTESGKNRFGSMAFGGYGVSVRNNLDRNQVYAAEMESQRAGRARGQYVAIGEAGRSGRDLMGMGLAQTQGFYSEVAAGGAGSARLAGQGYLDTAMAAATNTGLSASTLGAFAYGARQNAVAGGGSATDLLVSLQNQAKDLKFEGADQQQYLQQMAEGIRSFQTTGIPLQKDSIFGITKGLTGFGGMTALQANQAGVNLTSKANDLYESGPQSALDLAILKKGGFTGGIDSLLGTSRRMADDSGEYAKNFLNVLPDLASSPDKEVRIRELHKALGDEGISRDRRVAVRLERELRENPSQVSKRFAGLIAKSRDTQTAFTDEDYKREAAGKVSPIMRQQADMANQGVVAGEGAAAVSMEMESVANDVAVSFSKFSGLLLRIAKVASSIGGAASGGNAAAVAPSVRPAKG